jgi:hypothetical protein
MQTLQDIKFDNFEIKVKKISRISLYGNTADIL